MCKSILLSLSPEDHDATKMHTDLFWCGQFCCKITHCPPHPTPLPPDSHTPTSHSSNHRLPHPLCSLHPNTHTHTTRFHNQGPLSLTRHSFCGHGMNDLLPALPPHTHTLSALHLSPQPSPPLPFDLLVWREREAGRHLLQRFNESIINRSIKCL